uniref:hypothetical protein n=1 Tax=Pyropia seriata TaxID=79731 RepID=UPI00286A60FF|nr:hypothetical protein RMC01_mgp08 [Neoporphyra seriata]WKD83596.1 hypothetical protein [Neoporphyra seriata]
MRSRTLQYKNHLFVYDFLTQYSIKNSKKVPILSSINVKIENIKIDDINQFYLNLVSTQLLGHSYVLCKSTKDILNLESKSMGTNAYFVLENTVLAVYKKKASKILKEYFSNTGSIVYSKDFLSIIEYFSSDQKVLKLAEKASTKHLKIIFSFKINNSTNSSKILYFFKSLGYPY